MKNGYINFEELYKMLRLTYLSFLPHKVPIVNSGVVLNCYFKYCKIDVVIKHHDDKTLILDGDGVKRWGSVELEAQKGSMAYLINACVNNIDVKKLNSDIFALDKWLRMEKYVVNDMATEKMIQNKSLKF